MMTLAPDALLDDAETLLNRHATGTTILIGHSLGARIVLSLLLRLARTGRLGQIDAALLIARKGLRHVPVIEYLVFVAIAYPVRARRPFHKELVNAVFPCSSFKPAARCAGGPEAHSSTKRRPAPSRTNGTTETACNPGERSKR